MRLVRSSMWVVVAVLVVACGADLQGPAANEAGDTPETAASAADQSDAGSVAFAVQLSGGEVPGAYQVESANRCMAIVNAPDAQLNVNAFRRDSELSYAQISLNGFTFGEATSEEFIFVAKVGSHDLRIDTVPNSIVGNEGTGSVSWRVADRSEIVIEMEGSSDDGVEVRATVTCHDPSWTGV